MFSLIRKRHLTSIGLSKSCIRTQDYVDLWHYGVVNPLQLIWWNNFQNNEERKSEYLQINRNHVKARCPMWWTEQYNKGKGHFEKRAQSNTKEKLNKSTVMMLQLHHLGMFNCHAGHSKTGMKKANIDNTSKHCTTPFILLSFNHSEPIHFFWLKSKRLYPQLCSTEGPILCFLTIWAAFTVLEGIQSISLLFNYLGHRYLKNKIK